MSNNNDNNIKSKSNKIIIVVSGIMLLVTIVLLIAFSFVKSKYPFEITKPIIILVTFLVVIFLSNSFDNFQIGKLLTLKRNVSEYKEKNEKLENDKNELIKQIINLNVQSQHTSNVNYNGIPLDILQKSVSVQQADEEEVEKNKSQEDNELSKETKSIYRRIDRAKLENLAIKKCFGELIYDSILQDVKLNNKFGDTDPIANRNIIFDAYYNDNEKEKFIEVNQYASGMFFDRLYVMLNKIYNYNNIKKARANLTLIIPKFPDENETRRSLYSDVERFREVFAPAIASGLLNISQINISNEEMNDLYIDASK